ncbi:MAG: nicotinate (nicotinamide) nucleotide adenylyltransferase [Bacteroidales bacterium]|nr:nicotinate (nicotinamide) nucleotide adenylyltransferase [Bacteroidales bacterium]
MKIAVYSGSFNPLHKGHEAIIRFLTQEAGFDKVYLVVTPQNPFKVTHSLPAGEERFQAAVEAVKRHPDLKVEVKDIELKMTPPQYTIRTLDTLREREPENNFTLVIGADNLASFAGWRFHERILREYGVVVFPRKGFHRGHDKARLLKEDPSYKIRLLKAPLVTISSTEIRAGMAAGKDMSGWLM